MAIIEDLEEGVELIWEIDLVALIVVVATIANVELSLQILKLTEDVSSRLDDCMVIIKV